MEKLDLEVVLCCIVLPPSMGGVHTQLPAQLSDGAVARVYGFQPTLFPALNGFVFCSLA